MGIPTSKDANLVLRYAFDDATNSIRTNATFSGSVTVDLDQADDSVAIGDGTTLYTGTTVGPDHALDVNVVQSVLPSGAATASAQATGNASLSSIDTKLTTVNTRPLDASTDNVAISDNTNTASVTAEGRLNVASIAIFTKPYDAITVTYPLATQEVYQSRVGGIAGVVQETVTINYTDSTKNFITNVART